MAERIKLHPETPHQKRVFEIADSIKNDGSVILLPTDSQYALKTKRASTGSGRSATWAKTIICLYSATASNMYPRLPT